MPPPVLAAVEKRGFPAFALVLPARKPWFWFSIVGDRRGFRQP